MRRCVLFVLFAAFAFPAFAAKRITVEQLEQTLSNAKEAPDADLAKQLSDLELTERLSSTKLANLKAGLVGYESRQALEILADESSFLPLPAAEVPANPTPDGKTQRQIMALVVSYVTKTIHQLPNFSATRDTIRFEDRPQDTWNSFLPLHYVGKSGVTVVYRDGQEMVDTGPEKVQKREPAAQGLVSWGEFGPILSTVLLDAAQSKLAWSGWEQGATGPEAVFRYEVPGQKSHYWVQFCCIADEVGNPGSALFREHAGYHGELAVDPSTGAILRLSLEADLALGDPLTRAAMMVEYSSVEIGGKSFVCPVRSVALSMRHRPPEGVGMHSAALDQGPLKTLLNEVAFGQYHRLGAESRILMADGSEPAANSPAAGAELPNTSRLQPLSSMSPNTPSTDASKPADNPASSASAAPVETSSVVASPLATAPAAPSAPEEPEINVAASKGIPDAPLIAPSPERSAYVLKLNARLVDVGVVVVDKKGYPVKNLRRDDFEVYDNGRKQDVKFFSEFLEASLLTAESSAAPAAKPERTFSNQPASAPASDDANSAASSTDANTTILLLDESHIAWSDLSHARQEILKFLNALAPDEKVGLYTLTGLGFRVLTEITPDHAAVIARLNKWMPSAQSISQAQQDETRNRQQFETVHSSADLGSVNGNQNDVPDSQAPIDPQLLTMGSNPGRASLIILRSVARHLAAIPGHKSLVWISSDNVFVDWRDQSVATDKNTTTIDSYALHAQEAMNEAHVAVYPFDVSQLEAGSIGADIGNRNVMLDPTVTSPAGMARDMTAGRTKADMLEDIRPIQGPIRQLADATGGRIIRRTGDLAAALGSIVQDERATYQLSFYPDTAPDDLYHAVTVKIEDKKGLTLRGRTGYLYSKEPATMKERIQQAIWQPMDAGEIKVTAAISGAQPDANLKISIATADLDMRQQAARWTDKVDVFFIQRDDAGLHAEVEGQTLGLRLTPATYQSMRPSGIPFEHLVKLHSSTGSVRVLVVDENTGHMGSVTIPASALSTVAN